MIILLRALLSYTVKFASQRGLAKEKKFCNLSCSQLFIITEEIFNKIDIKTWTKNLPVVQKVAKKHFTTALRFSRPKTALWYLLHPKHRLVPVHTWATSMTAFLCSQCLWEIVSGRENEPLDLPSGRAAVAATSTSPAQLAIPAPTQEEVS